MLSTMGCPSVLAELDFVTRHSVGLAGASLSVGENSCRISIQCGIYQLINATTAEYIILPSAFVKNRIESELL